MRKLFSLFLALVATTSLWAHDFQSGDLYYNITSSSAPYTVKVSDAEWSITSAVIPSTVTYNGTTYSVTSIGDAAFGGCSSLTSITIPNSVTTIGRYAFSDCSSLTSVTIPNSVTSIGVQAFENCSSLTSVTIPNSVTSIGSYAFCDCSSLTTPVYNAYCFAYMPTSFKGAYVIPEGIKQIAGGAFSWCSSLTSVTIPNSVTSIGVQAFYRCSSLATITISNSVMSIGGHAFLDCSSLTSPVYNAHCFAYLPTSFEGTYTVPDGIKQIAGGAFDECSSLTSITIPNSVTSIEYYAFRGCSSLDTLTCLAMTPPALGEDVFYRCDNPTLFVPCAALSDYQLHKQWRQFTTIECIASEEAETEEVVVESGTTTVIITWPTEDNADTYTIVIKKGNEVFCTLTFNADGQLISIAFAPGRDGNHPAQYAEAVANGGYRFTVTGLEEGTDYTYDITVKDASNKTIKSHSGKFTTESLTAVENTHIQSPISNCQKILCNGQLIILRDGVEYNAMGQEL